MTPRVPSARAAAANGGDAQGALRTLPFVGDDARLVEALRAGSPSATAALYDRFVHHVDRMLIRVLGPERDLDDVRQDVFVRVLRGVGRLRNPEGLGAWITVVAVGVARTCIRSRRRRRWLGLFAGGEVPDVPAPPSAGADPQEREAVRATYALLDELPVNERVAFALRFVEGMELTEVAAACGVSLATAKRRLARASRRFAARAIADPVLREWIEKGGRWNPSEPSGR